MTSIYVPTMRHGPYNVVCYQVLSPHGVIYAKALLPCCSSSGQTGELQKSEESCVAQVWIKIQTARNTGMYYIDLNMAPQVGLAASFARVASGGITVKFSPVASKVFWTIAHPYKRDGKQCQLWLFLYIFISTGWMEIFFLFYMKLSSSNGSNTAFQWKSSKI